MDGTIETLRRDGRMRPDADRCRPYVVRVCFLNPNADYDLIVSALNRTNAIWVAAERLQERGEWPNASIGPIRRA